MAQIQGLTLLFGTLLGADGGITGSLSKTLGALTVSSDATVVNPPVTADLNVTLGALTLTSDATAINPITADLSATLGVLTLSADATITNPAYTADLTATLGVLALSSDASIAVNVTADLTATLGALTLSADTTVTQILFDDTHDGDYLKKRLRAERKAAKRRRKQVLDLYEQLVEGKEPPPPEVVAIIEEANIQTRASIAQAPSIEFDKMLAALERAVELHRQIMLEQDDEEVLLLI